MTYTWKQGTYTDGRPVLHQWVCYDADEGTVGIIERGRLIAQRESKYTLIAYQNLENGKVHMTCDPFSVETVAEGQRLIEQWLTPEGHRAVHATHCRLI